MGGTAAAIFGTAAADTAGTVAVGDIVGSALAGDAFTLASADVAAQAAAGAISVTDALAAGASVSDLASAGALTDLGGGTFLDTATNALVDSTGTALTDLGGGSYLNAATGALVDSTGSALPQVSSGVFQAADGSFLSAAGDPLTQSAVDGSFLNTNTGEIIDATGGAAQGAQDATNILQTGVTPAEVAKYGQQAYSVLNKILAPATKAIQTGQNLTGAAAGQMLPSLSGLQTPTSTTQTTSGTDTGFLTPTFSKGNTDFTLSDNSVNAPAIQPYTAPVSQGLMAPVATPQLATGGLVDVDGQEQEHVPQFYSEGGLQHRYVKGDGDGTSDDVPAMLANGEFVIPADVVSSLGNGSNDSGSKVLDNFLETIREHKQKHDAKHLPPDSKGPLAYLLEANKKVKS